MILNSGTMAILRPHFILHEGEEFDLYPCTEDKLTIGIGRNIEDNGISQDESDLMFKNDITRSLDECVVNFPWFSGMPLIRQIVVLDMVFNMGITRMTGPKGFPKFRQACSVGDWEEAAREMEDSDWFDQVGDRSKRLQYYMRFNRTDWEK